MNDRSLMPENWKILVIPLSLMFCKDKRKTTSYATNRPETWRNYGRSAADSVEMHKRRGYFADSEPGFTPPWLLAIPLNFLFALFILTAFSF